MTKMARNRRVGYAVFLALVFFIIVTMPGFHDNSLKTSLIVYLSINLLFSIWILKINVVVRICIGLLIASLSLVGSYYIQSFFFSLLSDAITAAIVFFIIYSIIFVGLWEFALFLFARLRKKALN